MPADVKLYVTDEIGETRHVLRNEFAEAVVKLHNELAGIRQDIQVGNFADLNEFAALKNGQADAKRELGDLKHIVHGLEPRVRKLEQGAMTSDKVAQALREQKEQAERNRVQIRNWMLSLCGLVLGFAGFALSNLH